MKEQSSLFEEEIRQKQKERSALRSKTGSKGSSRSRKGVRTPFDFMTTKEKRKLNSEVSVKNLFDLLQSKKEFETYPPAKQTEILTRWREIYPNTKIMESLEIQSQGAFNTLLERLNVPKKRSWSRKPKEQPRSGKLIGKEKVPSKENAEKVAAPVDPVIEKMDVTILDGLNLKYNGAYNSEQLSKILTKLQLLVDGEENNFIVSISLQESLK